MYRFISVINGRRGGNAHGTACRDPFPPHAPFYHVSICSTARADFQFAHLDMAIVHDINHHRIQWLNRRFRCAGHRLMRPPTPTKSSGAAICPSPLEKAQACSSPLHLTQCPLQASSYKLACGGHPDPRLLRRSNACVSELPPSWRRRCGLQRWQRR